ncbi:hypothetical protein LQU94_07900 [Peptoniphilus sp. KCTC 25270]|uniref:ribonuclease H-like domain-containing protein n=1 Tax=Peptoniphilus sp. KCTC 25270 TaxID=2897414 RepID=UPI001E55FCF3|nr:ribonuclease H-like domain-containing protein [Peptoniphilus sp. KCTC 25270]MCD1148031.1 hypothetical protein [Peptoniphilus sp. KCTC 25270]
MEKKNTNHVSLVQIYTSGYQKRFDEIFAYGIYIPHKDTFQIARIQKNQSTKNFLLPLYQYIQSNTGIIFYTFNSKFESSLFFKEYKDIQEEWKNQSLDLYVELRKYKFLKPRESYSMKSFAKEMDPRSKITLGPKLYETYYPFEEKDDVPMFQAIQQNLTAMNTIRKMYEDLLKECKYEAESFTATIESAQENGKQWEFSGKISPSYSQFLHKENFLYEEKEGTFSLTIFPIHTYYNQEDSCSVIEIPYKIQNPIPLPEGYLLLAYNKEIYLPQIFTLLHHIRQTPENKETV